MKKFKEYMIENSGKGYASLQLVEEYKDKILMILSKLKISDVIDDMHITLIYDRSNPISKIKIDPRTVYNADIIGVKTLGEPGTKWYAITLELDSPELVNRHADYIEAGFTHSYPNFIPHMSLKYKPTKTEIKTIEDNLDLFKTLRLQFSEEKLKEIKND